MGLFLFAALETPGTYSANVHGIHRPPTADLPPDEFLLIDSLNSECGDLLSHHHRALESFCPTSSPESQSWNRSVGNPVPRQKTHRKTRLIQLVKRQDIYTPGAIASAISQALYRQAIAQTGSPLLSTGRIINQAVSAFQRRKAHLSE